MWQADVAELADAIDLGSIARKGVEVRVLSSALEWFIWARGLAGRRLLCKEKIVGSNPTGSTLIWRIENFKFAHLNAKRYNCLLSINID